MRPNSLVLQCIVRFKSESKHVQQKETKLIATNATKPCIISGTTPTPM